MLHSTDSAHEHNNISHPDASHSTVLPSAVSSERPSMPSASVYASAGIAAAGSQAELLQEDCAALELGACPDYGSMACPWQEDEGMLTETDPLDAYTGMHLPKLLLFPPTMCRALAYHVS